MAELTVAVNLMIILVAVDPVCVCAAGLSVWFHPFVCICVCVYVTQKMLFCTLPAIYHCKSLHAYCLLLRFMLPKMLVSHGLLIEHHI